MIRPFTCACLLLAGGSGLYLYQSKHRVQLLDRDIEQIVRATEAARARTGVLRAEWTLMNDPERLGQLAEKFLSLKTTTPGQFTTMADLDRRLPAVRAPEPAHEQPTDEDAVVAEAPKPEPVKPEPPKVVAAAHPAAAAKPRPVQAVRAPELAILQPAALPSLLSPQVAAASLAHAVAYAPPASAPAAARVTPLYAPVATPASPPAAAPPPTAGSSLGMARTTQPYRTSP